jgi:acyl-CoA reductase-like NAD-dependent aldehyde dehydrogenase
MDVSPSHPLLDIVTKQCHRVYNPATAQPLAEVQSASPEDVDKAVKAARQAFRTTWGKKVSGQEKSRCE